MPIFEGIKFFCTSTLSENRRLDLTTSLESNGAESVPLEDATHIITLALDYEGQDRAKGGSVTVTVRFLMIWSHIYVLTPMSRIIGLSDPWSSEGFSCESTEVRPFKYFISDLSTSVQHFSPDPSMLFSGVVACATDVRLPRLAQCFAHSFLSSFPLISKSSLLESRRLEASGVQG